MAVNVEFTKELRPALNRAKSKCLEKVSTGEGYRRVSGFFSELESAAESLQDNRNRDSKKCITFYLQQAWSRKDYERCTKKLFADSM